MKKIMLFALLMELQVLGIDRSIFEGASPWKPNINKGSTECYDDDEYKQNQPAINLLELVMGLPVTPEQAPDSSQYAWKELQRFPNCPPLFRLMYQNNRQILVARFRQISDSIFPAPEQIYLRDSELAPDCKVDIVHKARVYLMEHVRRYEETSGYIPKCNIVRTPYGPYVCLRSKESGVIILRFFDQYEQLTLEPDALSRPTAK